MNTDEIVKALRERFDKIAGAYEVMSALAEARKEEIESLATQLAESQRRADAAVEDLKLALIDEALDPCHCCEYGCTDHCTHPGGPTCGETGGKNWKWRGPQNEKGE